jgi:uncharacterized coiled-coil protein SlyX
LTKQLTAVNHTVASYEMERLAKDQRIYELEGMVKEKEHELERVNAKIQEVAGKSAKEDKEQYEKKIS